MSEETQDESQVLETETPTEEVAETPADETTTEETLSQEEIKTLKEKAAEAEALRVKNKQLYERAKKAEAKAPSKSEPTNLSAKDFLALKDANISAEDFDDVQEFASFKGLPIAEVLKHPTMKTILADKAEERRTAQATQTKGGQRGTAKIAGEELLARAERTGEVPETDEGMKDLFSARLARRLQLKRK